MAISINAMTNSQVSNGASNGMSHAFRVEGNKASSVLLPSTPVSSQETDVKVEKQKISKTENSGVLEEKIESKKHTGQAGELRDLTIEDGKYITRVYSNEGKLLRQIPPGYVPFGVQELNILV